MLLALVLVLVVVGTIEASSAVSDKNQVGLPVRDGLRNNRDAGVPTVLRGRRNTRPWEELHTTNRLLFVLLDRLLFALCAHRERCRIEAKNKNW